MANITKDEFKQAVTMAFAEKGIQKIIISMALFGMQCTVSYNVGHLFGGREAKVYYKEKNGRRFIQVYNDDELDWEWDIPSI